MTIPADEEVLLSPLAKWRKYGMFPRLLFLHFLLVASSLYHVVAYNSVHGVTRRIIGQVRPLCGMTT